MGRKRRAVRRTREHEVQCRMEPKFNIWLFSSNKIGNKKSRSFHRHCHPFNTLLLAGKGFDPNPNAVSVCLDEQTFFSLHMTAPHRISAS